jgi:hypothetical protein
MYFTIFAYQFKNKSMRKIIFFLAIPLIFQTVSAQTNVSEEWAKHIAIKCLLQKMNHESLDVSSYVFGDISEVKTVFSANNQPLFYIVNFNPPGWVIVSATKTYHPVIAFSWEGNFEYPVTAPAASMWIENEERKILQSLKIPERHQQIDEEWDFYEMTDILNIGMRHERIVLPMLTTQWNQGTFYNEYCPADPAGPDHRTYAGCVATAIGQVMNYFRYPLQGTGSYTSEYTVYGTHTVNYSEAEYSWNEMPLKLTRSNHPVAELLYHIGVSVDMNYGPNGSGMWNHKAAHTMQTFFGYTDSTQYNFRDTTTIDWNAMLIDHLDREIVLYYAGWTDSQYVSGHAFVCDGYQDSSFFHFNWGWGGAYDGYFHIDNLIVGGNDFTTMHEAVINGTPATNYPYYCSGTDTLRTLDGTIEDGSGPIDTYLDNTNCSWLIMPDDTVEYITLDFIKCDLENPSDLVRIYDGATTSAPLLGTFTGSGPATQIVSTANKVLVQFESNGSVTERGFLISYTAKQVKTCNSLTTLTASSGTITDGSNEYDYQNASICRWRIEPPGAQFFSINFSEFDIDSTDMVKITDTQANVIIGEYTGAQLPADLSVWTTKLMVTFTAGVTSTAGGFILHYNSSLQSTEEMMKNFINIYPNPASDLVTIQADEPLLLKHCKIDLLTITGQHIESFTPAENEEKIIINVSHIPSGMYLLAISGKDGYTVTKKISVLR